MLCTRKQRVIVNGIYSQLYSVASGIPMPQGSILGPLLFNRLYINDLPTVTESTNSGMHLYADYAKIYITVSSANDSECLQKVIELNIGMMTGFHL